MIFVVCKSCGDGLKLIPDSGKLKEIVKVLAELGPSASDHAVIVWDCEGQAQGAYSDPAELLAGLGTSQDQLLSTEVKILKAGSLKDLVDGTDQTDQTDR